VVVAAGGGNIMLLYGLEGLDIAERYNEWGVAAFILNYRLSPRYGENAVADERDQPANEPPGLRPCTTTACPVPSTMSCASSSWLTPGGFVAKFWEEATQASASRLS